MDFRHSTPYLERNTLYSVGSQRSTNFLVTKNDDGTGYRKSVINLIRESSNANRLSVVTPLSP